MGHPGTSLNRFLRPVCGKEGPQVSFTEGNAEKLETIPSDSQDLYTIAFGIRNCTHVDRVLKEAHRVLKPGGVFSCLEFSKVTNPLLAKSVTISPFCDASCARLTREWVSRVYETYSFSVIPNLGHIIAADRDSYQVSSSHSALCMHGTDGPTSFSTSWSPSSVSPPSRSSRG